MSVVLADLWLKGNDLCKSDVSRSRGSFDTRALISAKETSADVMECSIKVIHSKICIQLANTHDNYDAGGMPMKTAAKIQDTMTKDSASQQESTRMTRERRYLNREGRQMPTARKSVPSTVFDEWSVASTLWTSVASGTCSDTWQGPTRPKWPFKCVLPQEVMSDSVHPPKYVSWTN